MGQPFRVSVILPFYLGEPYLAKGIASIHASTYPVEKIYLIDNGPEAMSLSLDDPKVEVIRTRPSIGFGRACNIGIYKAVREGYEVCVLLNQDAVLQETCLEHLIRPFLLEPSIFAVVPVSLSYDQTHVYAKTLEKYIFPVPHLVEDLLIENEKPFYPVAYDQANGSCVALRASKVEKVGLFDPLFFMYGEDNDLFLRAKELFNQQIVLAPRAFIGHHHSNFGSTGRPQDRIESLSRYAKQVIQLKNPRKSFVARVFDVLKFNLHSTLRALLGLRFYRLWLHLKYDLQLIRRLPLVSKSRDPEFVKKRIQAFMQKDQL